MEYFFIPGRLKSLSWAELEAVSKNILGSSFTLVDKNQYFILKTTADGSFVEKIFLKLGGFLKYGKILDENMDFKELAKGVKVVFGISAYGFKYSFFDLKKLSKELKDNFISLEKKVRFVLPQEDLFLSTSQVLNNKLLSEGFEMVLLDEGVAQTLGVQDIENFSARDYDKPFVDKEMGVMPIKLARIMINLANIKENQLLWDPFCGSGNILLEGLDLGYKVLGSDIDAKSLDGAKNNIDWAVKRFKYKNGGKVSYLDILNPTKSKLDMIKNSDLGGIVCEPYMGKPQRRVLEPQLANSLVKQHYSLVEGLFRILLSLNIEKKIRIVVIFPEYKTKTGWASIKKESLNFKNTKMIKFTEGLHWSRVNSIINRLIFVFEYIPR